MGSRETPDPTAAPAAAGTVGPDAATGPRVREDLVQPDPLLDGLVEICRLHGLTASRASLSAGLPLRDGRLTLSLADRAAARGGLATRLQRQALDAIDTAALPALLLTHGERACVLLGLDGDTARVLLPEAGAGEVTLSRAELATRHTGLVLYARPRHRFDSRAPAAGPDASQPHWFWGAVLAQRFVYRDVLLAAALLNLFALALPVFTMNVYDRVVPNAALETLWSLAVGIVLVLGADLLLRRLRSRFVDEASARIDVQISATLMERVLGMRLAHRPESVGSFASNLRGFEQVRDLIASSTVTALVDLPFAALFLLAIAWISPWLLLPVVVALLAIVGNGWAVQGRLHALSQSTWRAGAMRNATLVEALAGIETIRTQGAEGQVQARWEQTNRFLAATNVRMRALSSGAVHLTQTITQLATVAGVVIGVYLIGDKSLSMGALVAVGMLGARALAPAGQVVALLMQWQGARTALEGLEGLMATPVERPEGQVFVQRRELRGEIELRQVRFAYPRRDDPAVDGVSLRIQPGERVALIGRVGSGKSTLQRLMMGLYTPTAGQVLIDGIDLRQLDPADLRRNLACVSQDVLLFHGTLRENIAFGLPQAEDAEIVAAAEVAGLTDFVQRHPQGFDMPVGERGELLSGGQRQAVGIARAVLHHTPILLLDEPTSAMDFSTEAGITQRLGAYAQGRTVVLVTHRTSLLAMVDRVIVVDAGKVVADGPRDRIMDALQSGRIARAA